jgi:hypothetical protein
MCIDDDLGFEPTAIARFVEHDKDIVAGVYPVKTMPIFYPYQPAGPVGNDGLQLAQMVPGGFMLIKRHVMQKLAETVPRFNVEHNNESMSCPDLYSMTNRAAAKHGEDVMFCERALAAGFEIHVDPAVGFVHVGMFEWGGQLSNQLERQRIAEEAAADALAEKPLILTDPDVGKVRPVAAAINGALHR